MKFSDLDLDIPSMDSTKIRLGLIRARVKSEKGGFQPHPAGVYFYKNIPSYESFSILDYKEMEQHNYQKIDILNNTYLDNITADDMNNFVKKIENEDIDWKLLWSYTETYQLSKYPGILREFKVSSVLDIAIVLAIIRPGSIKNYDKMKTYIHTNVILDKKSDSEKDILRETYGIPVFDEQFKALGLNDDNYRYKKPHSLGYAYVLLIDFLKNS